MAISQVVAMTAAGVLYNTVPPNAAGSGAGGNGGAVAKASGSTLLDGVSVSRYDAGVFGSTVIDNNDADKAVSSEPFAKNNQSPIGKVLTSSPAAQPSLIQSIHKIQVLGMGYTDGVRTRKQTTAIRQGYWNDYTGQFDPGYPVVSVDVFDSDIAADPTRLVPGTLTFKGSAPNAVTENYDEKTG